MQLKFIKLLLGCLLSIIVTGCATLENNDPLETVNRGVYKFNDAIDGAVLKPVAGAYKAVTPSFVRKAINNFFNNLQSLTTVLNDLLQLKFEHAFKDTGRFVINSTFGLAGLIDVASMDDVPVHREDFGQTLGHWGVKNGAYLVLPFLGPSTIRDATGFVIDTSTSDPIAYAHNIGQIHLHNQLRATQLIDRRVGLLGVSDILKDASLDPYAFIRDAYFQSRESHVQDAL
ncbi:MAG: VacJ family lipoprotein [Methylophilaceae bacterium]